MSHGAAILKMMGVLYLGHDPLMFGILDRKYIFKQNVSCNSLPTAAFRVFNPEATGTRTHARIGASSGPLATKTDHSLQSRYLVILLFMCML